MKVNGYSKLYSIQVEVPFRCGFEEDFCGLDPGNSPYVWKRGSIGTVHPYGTGPVSAYEGGYYIYADAHRTQFQAGIVLMTHKMSRSVVNGYIKN